MTDSQDRINRRRQRMTPEQEAAAWLKDNAGKMQGMGGVASVAEMKKSTEEAKRIAESSEGRDPRDGEPEELDV